MSINVTPPPPLGLRESTIWIYTRRATGRQLSPASLPWQWSLSRPRGWCGASGQLSLTRVRLPQSSTHLSIPSTSPHAPIILLYHWKSPALLPGHARPCVHGTKPQSIQAPSPSCRGREQLLPPPTTVWRQLSHLCGSLSLYTAKGLVCCQCVYGGGGG